MAGTKVNNYAIGDSDIEAVMLTTDHIYKGQCQVSLTEMSTTIVPKIAAGSWVEVNGTLFKFDTDETLTGSPSDGIVYIRIVPSTTTCTAEMTNTAPTWSDSKQGWYGTGGAANYRYIPIWMYKISSSYKKSNKIHRSRFVNLISGLLDYDETYDYGYEQTTTALYSRYAETYNKNVIMIDALSEISTGKITISKTGYYRITTNCSLYIAATATRGIFTKMQLEVEGIKIKPYSYHGMSGETIQNNHNINMVVFFNSGDELKFYQEFIISSSTLSVFRWYTGYYDIEMI